MREGGLVPAQIAALQASTTAGHAVRGAAIGAWSQGELVGSVLRSGAIEDALAAALVADLISSGRFEP